MKFVQGLGAELVEPRALQGDVVGPKSTASAEPGQGLNIAILGHVVAGGETQESLVVIAELMIEPRRSQVFALIEREQAAVGFELIDHEIVQRGVNGLQPGGWAYGQGILQNGGADVGRSCSRGAIETRNRGCSPGRQRA